MTIAKGYSVSESRITRLTHKPSVRQEDIKECMLITLNKDTVLSGGAISVCYYSMVVDLGEKREFLNREETKKTIDDQRKKANNVDMQNEK